MREVNRLHETCCLKTFLSFSVAYNNKQLWITSFKVASGRLKIFIRKYVVWVSFTYFYLCRKTYWYLGLFVTSCQE